MEVPFRGLCDFSLTLPESSDHSGSCSSGWDRSRTSHFSGNHENFVRPVPLEVFTLLMFNRPTNFQRQNFDLSLPKLRSLVTTNRLIVTCSIYCLGSQEGDILPSIMRMELS